MLKNSEILEIGEILFVLRPFPELVAGLLHRIPRFPVIVGAADVSQDRLLEIDAFVAFFIESHNDHQFIIGPEFL
jgi:hypothetical protein